MSAHKLSNDFNVSLEEAEQFIENFHATYPKLKSYFQKVQSEALSTGKILINRFTNHRYLADSVYRKYQEAKGVIDASKNSFRKVDKTVWKQFFVSKGEIERKSQNYPIQGSGALMSKLAAILFNRAIKANKLNATLVNMVHDELVVETEKEIAEQVLALLVQCMERAGKLLIKKLPIVASGKISEFWAH